MTSAASARIGLTNVATNHYRQGFVDGWVAAHKVLTPEEQHEPMAGGPGCLCTGLEDSPYWPVNPLCPIHGDVRDTGFVIDSKDDRITAIEDAIEELDR